MVELIWHVSQVVSNAPAHGYGDFLTLVWFFSGRDWARTNVQQNNNKKDSSHSEHGTS